MARKATYASRRGKEQHKPQHTCRECAHSYDWQNRSFNDGHLILCRCPHDAKSHNGKFCKFLSDPECQHYKPRPSNAPDYAEAH